MVRPQLRRLHLAVALVLVGFGLLVAAVLAFAPLAIAGLAAAVVGLFFVDVEGANESVYPHLPKRPQS